MAGAHDIEFLPASYRARNKGRKLKLRRWALALVLVAAVVAAAWRQRGQIAALRARADDVAERYEQMEADRATLLELESELARLVESGQVQLELRRLWPLSRLLAEVVAPLPADVRLTRVAISHRGYTSSRWSSAAQASKQAIESAPPAQRDVQALRREMGGAIAIHVSGYSASEPLLHDYLRRLKKAPQFDQVLLKRLEAAPGLAERSGRGALSFQLEIKVDFDRQQHAPPPVARQVAARGEDL